MENASKALIIAGAILLAILLITLGIGVVRIAQGAMSGVTLDPQKVQAYNSEFENYADTQSGTSVRALLDAIRQHNNAHTDDATLNIAVHTSGTAATSAPTELVTAATVNGVKSNIKAGKTYTVTFGYDANSGYIVDCVIVEKTK